MPVPVLRRMVVCGLLVALALPAASDEPVFSGPQKGEKLAPFKVVSVIGREQGVQVDPVEVAAGKPSMFIFVHKLTRPGAALMRGLTAYATKKFESKAAVEIVWLADDKAGAEMRLSNIQKSLNFTVPVGVSIDGGEGPGAYGLNRNVELTILIANDGTVTANHALVQPSPSEAAKIATDLVALFDQPPPTNEEINKLAYPGRNMQRNPNMRRQQARTQRGDADRGGVELRGLMRKFLEADEKGVDEAAKAIEKWVAEDKSRQAALARMSGFAIQRVRGKKAKAKLEAWKKYAPPAESNQQQQR